MLVRLNKTVRPTFTNGLHGYREGAIVEVTVADNLPADSNIAVWIVQDGWENDPYGLGLGWDDFDLIDEVVEATFDFTIDAEPVDFENYERIE